MKSQIMQSPASLVFLATLTKRDKTFSKKSDWHFGQYWCYSSIKVNFTLNSLIKIGIASTMKMKQKFEFVVCVKTGRDCLRVLPWVK